MIKNIKSMYTIYEDDPRIFKVKLGAFKTYVQLIIEYFKNIFGIQCKFTYNAKQGF